MDQKKDLTRRDASKIAAAAATLSITGAPFISKVKAANNTVQFGFIGTGSRGQYLLQHLKSIDNGTCVAVCDVYEPNMRKGAELIGTKPKQFKDYRELLADKSVDAVLIATPLYMHYPVTKDALDAGKHVFCE